VIRTTSVLVSVLSAMVILAGPAPILGQGVTVDDGEFRISIDGRVVGVETFSIQRSAAGGPERVIAQGVVEIDRGDGPESLRPVLDLRGESLEIFAYMITRTAKETTTVSIKFIPPHFVATTESPAGRREKEIRADPGVIFLEDHVAHQYYFLARAIEAGATRVPAIIPLEGRRVELALSVEAESTILIGGRSLPARRVTLGTGTLMRRVWLDPQGRVLRVEVPAIGYEAVRTAPPS